jgi:hypothetical protein
MQIAHCKNLTTRCSLTIIDTLAAHVDAVQANLHGTMCGDGEIDALRSQVLAAEDLLSQLQVAC